MLILVSVIIILPAVALCTKGNDHRGYKMNMMTQTEKWLATTSVELQ